MRIKEMGMRATACAAAAAFATGIGFHPALADEHSGIDIRLPIVVLSNSEGVGTGLMVAENMGSEGDALIGASAPDGIEVEIHLAEDEDRDGVVQMREVDELHLASGATSIMSPTGPHLMLFNMDPEAEAGDVIDMTLNFKELGPIEIRALVLDEAPAMEVIIAAYLDVHPSKVFSEANAIKMEMHEEMYGGMFDEMYGGMHDLEPEVVYVPVPVYIPAPAMPGGYGHGMGYGFGPMGYGYGGGHGFDPMGGGHGMGHGFDPMGYGHGMGHGFGPMGYGHGMGHGFGPMGGGHGMGHGFDPMDHGYMPEPHLH